MSKINFSGFMVVLCFIFINAACPAKESNPPLPNIIYILADDLGYGDLSGYNEEAKIKTPVLDQLAHEGLRFTDAHTSSSVCTPTRYGILTGRYNWRTKLKKSVLGGESNALIPNDRTTVASMLKDQGYTTAYIGKWHLGWDWARNEEGEIDFSKPVTNTPNDLGFDYAYGHCGSLDMAPYVYVENGMSTSIPTKITKNKGQKFWRKGLTGDDFIHEEVTPNFIDRAINYVAEKAKEEKAFFLYLPLPSPHTPILPTEEYQGISGLDNPYGDFVVMIDTYLGKLVDQVKKSGIEENTMIIFTSDNGCSPKADYEQLLSKGHNPSYIYRGHKADIFEGGHRIPFIVKWPQKINKERLSDKTICTTDLMATCAEIVGYDLKDNEGEDSYSFLPILEEKTVDDFRKETIHHSINGSFAMRKENWKLIMCAGSGGWSEPKPGNKDLIASLPTIQLYDLEKDPGETTNLESTFPEKVEELKALLIKQINEGRSTPGALQENDPIDFEWTQLSFMNE